MPLPHGGRWIVDGERRALGVWAGHSTAQGVDVMSSSHGIPAWPEANDTHLPPEDYYPAVPLLLYTV